jgi:hypothetical protein
VSTSKPEPSLPPSFKATIFGPAQASASVKINNGLCINAICPDFIWRLLDNPDAGAADEQIVFVLDAV